MGGRLQNSELHTLKNHGLPRKYRFLLLDMSLGIMHNKAYQQGNQYLFAIIVM